jgi:membrane peptidoglycan carboxypeptidase
VPTRTFSQQRGRVSSRDFDGRYTPDRRGADEFGGSAWRGGQLDDPYRDSGYDRDELVDRVYDPFAADGGDSFDGNGYSGVSFSGDSQDANGYGGDALALDAPSQDERRLPAEHGRSGSGAKSRRAPAGRPGTTRGYRSGGAGGRGRPPGRRGVVKVKGSWWRHWTWKKAVGIGFAGVGGLIVAAVATVGVAYAKTPVPTDFSQAAQQQQSVVYLANGKVVGTFGTVDRQLLTYNQIPQDLRDSVVSAEDRGFWTEGGISPRGIARAAYDDVSGSGGSLQGGSTITQQFVRNYYANIGTAQTASRKIKEIFVALKVAKERSKQWILTQYLNTIYLGQGAYGVEAASETYFGIPASKLSPAQAAVIAAIIQQPSLYPLPQYRSQLMARWQYVLDGLVKIGDLTAAQAAAETFPKMGDYQLSSVGKAAYDPYILNVVQNELEDVYHYTPAQIDNGGLRIVTTINPTFMNALYSAVNQNETLMSEDGGELPSYAHVGAELQDPTTGAILAMYPGPGENMSAKECAIHHCDLNTAVQTREQIGSAFKPYVLAASVKAGMNVQTTTMDGYSPLWIPPDSESATPASLTKAGAQYNWFEETNDSNASYGPMTVANAEAQSSNTAFTDLIHVVGTRNVVNLAAEMGVDTTASGLTNDIGHVGMALGQDSLSVNEQATMMSTLDDGGIYHSAHIIQQITQGTTMTPAKVSQTPVLTSAQDYQVEYAMKFDTINGTGISAAMTDGRPIIAKTGTTNSAQSAFFEGAIPQYSLAVGIFSDDQTGDNKKTLNGLGGNVGGGFGGYWPARIWHTFAENEFAQLPIEQLPAPIFTGQAWNMVPANEMPKAKPAKHQNQNNNQNGNGNGNGGNQGNPVNNGTAIIPTPTASAGLPSAPAVPGAIAGGVLTGLPGTWLVSRRRRRKRKRS